MKIIYFLLLSLIYCSKLDNLFEESTKLLLELADKMKKKYFQRCSDKCICSVLSCSNGYEANFCSKAFDEEGCNCPGHRVNLDKLTTHIGNIYQTDEEIIQKVRTDESFRTTMCYANQLEEVIKKYEIPKEIFKIYFATTNGLFLSYPGLPDCRKYDHRVRPWWIGTITGSKNIIFLIDISKEVTAEKFTLMKEASSTILSFSNKSDKISLIPYDNKIYPGIYGLDGSLSNQNIIKDFLDKLTITNYPSDFHSVISSFFIKLREMKLNGNLMVSDIFIVNLTAGVPKSETTEVKTDNQFDSKLNLWGV